MHAAAVRRSVVVSGWTSRDRRRVRVHSVLLASERSKRIRQTTPRAPRVAAMATLKWRSDFDKFVVVSNFEKRGWERWRDPGPDAADAGAADAHQTSSSWNVYWANVHAAKHLFHPSAESRLGDHQVVNHFPNHYELTRKDLMVKNVKRYRKELEKEAALAAALRGNGLGGVAVPTPTDHLDFVPLTFSLPADYSLFAEEFRRGGGDNARATNATTWIMKPTGKAQGKGIFLVNKLAQVKRWANTGGALAANNSAAHSTSNKHQSDRDKTEPPAQEAYIVSRYVHNPLLIGGKKFDLRLYVTVTSYRPLRAFISKLGFARFCNVKYSGDVADIDNPFVHLTNVAIQKRGEEYNESHGNKWPLRDLRLHLESTRGKTATDALFAAMRDCVTHSLRAVSNVMVNDRHCFELYGYDLLVDESLKPWLIEVNASPSLSATTEADRRLKCRVIRDALLVAVPPGKLDAKPRDGGKRGVGVGAGGNGGHGGLGGVPPEAAETLELLVDEAAETAAREEREFARAARKSAARNKSGADR